LKKTFDAYNSWQLAKPGAQNQATDPATLTLLPGFKAELIRSSQPGEDSWVSMAFDPQGRITLGKEKKGLLRLTLSGSGDQKMETIDDELLECRGLLYAHGSLFANANNTKALFRLTDKDGDGVFEERKELMHTGGGVGHGRNHIKLGPDGDIYVAHGNNVLIPENVAPDSPLKNYANDQLIPNPWDGSMFDGNVELPAGHILRVKPDGSKITLLAGGLRNPLDIAFNSRGDLFTFDADMERDVGTPWYMPTRVLHVVPGADFGWRRGTGRFPRVVCGHAAECDRHWAVIADRDFLRLQIRLPAEVSRSALHPRLELRTHHCGASEQERRDLHSGTGGFCDRKTAQRHRRLHRTRWRDVVHHRRTRNTERAVSGHSIRPLSPTLSPTDKHRPRRILDGAREPEISLSPPLGMKSRMIHFGERAGVRGQAHVSKAFTANDLKLENRPVTEWREQALQNGHMHELLALARVGEKADLEPVFAAVMKTCAEADARRASRHGCRHRASRRTSSQRQTASPGLPILPTKPSSTANSAACSSI
jgi:hypothetical protein